MAASMWGTAVENFFLGEDDSAASSISQDLLNNDVKLVEVVDGLGKYLTDTDNNVRCQATRLLADILHKLGTDFLQQNEVDLLCHFLCGKLADHHSLQPPALHGLTALSSCSHIPDGVAEQICRQIFKEVQNQTLAQDDRRSVYIIFSNLLYKKLNELRMMGSDFVCGFIQAMDAERDPRNLVIAFQLAQTITHNFLLGVFVEEMFEVTSCYFPIDFKPSASDGAGISQEDLICALRGCMTASPQFGQFCLPLLIEKLTSDIVSAKIDSLNTLCEGCTIYGVDCIKEYMNTLFSCIKREVFAGTSQELTQAGLSAVTAIVTVLSRDITQRDMANTHLSDFTKEVLKECRRHILEPDLRLISPSCKLLQSAAAGSNPACWVILTLVIPTLLEQYAMHSQGSQRQSVLQNLKGFVDICRILSFSPEVPCPLSELQVSVLNVLNSAVEELSPAVRLAAVQLYSALLSVSGQLQEKVEEEEEVMDIGKHLLHHLLSDSSPEVRNECLCGLKIVTQLNIGWATNTLIPHITSVLHHEAMETNGSSLDTFTPSKEYLLTTLTSLANVTLMDVICRELLSYLTNRTEQLSLVAAQCFSQLSRENRHQKEITDYMYRTVLPGVFHVLLQPSSGHGDCGNLDEPFITELAAVFRLTTVALDRRKAEDLMKTVCEVIVMGNLAVMPEVKLSLGSFHPLQAVSPAHQTRLVAVLQAVLCSLSPQVSIPDVMSLLQSLVQLSFESCDGFTRLHACKCCAGIVNKLPEGDNLSNFVKKLQMTLTSVFDRTAGSEGRCRALYLLVWLTKALTLRGHSQHRPLVAMLVSLLEDEELCLDAAHGFLVLVCECDDVLTREMLADIHIFYRQRLFVENVAVLTKTFQTVCDDYKPCFLLAISYLLRFLPEQVLLGELTSVMPILVQSLLYPDTDLLLSILSKLTELTSHAPDILATHLDSVLPQLLKLSCQAPAMRVRMSSLKCLNSLCILPSHVTLPHRSKVTRSLEQVLDDKKRLVRLEAVAARGNWFLIGEPGK